LSNSAIAIHGVAGTNIAVFGPTWEAPFWTQMHFTPGQPGNPHVGPRVEFIPLSAELGAYTELDGFAMHNLGVGEGQFPDFREPVDDGMMSDFELAQAIRSFIGNRKVYVGHYSSYSRSALGDFPLAPTCYTQGCADTLQDKVPDWRRALLRATKTVLIYRDLDAVIEPLLLNSGGAQGQYVGYLDPTVGLDVANFSQFHRGHKPWVTAMMYLLKDLDGATGLGSTNFTRNSLGVFFAMPGGDTRCYQWAAENTTAPLPNLGGDGVRLNIFGQTNLNSVLTEEPVYQELP
jgi:hypothetical protein